MRFGTTELIIILVIIMVIFGVGKLPQVSSSMGKAIRSFRRGVDGKDEEAAVETETPAGNKADP